MHTYSYPTSGQANFHFRVHAWVFSFESFEKRPNVLACLLACLFRFSRVRSPLTTKTVHGPLGLRFCVWHLQKFVMVGNICWEGQAASCSSCIHISILRFIRWHSRNKRTTTTGKIVLLLYYPCLCKTSQKPRSVSRLACFPVGLERALLVYSCT